MCTAVRFNGKDGSLYFGRNLDWIVGYGQHVVAIPAGHQNAYAFMEETPSKHALIGMGIVFEGLPLFFDCGNDAGLAVAGLNFPGYAAYEKDAVPGKTNIAAYEMPWWIASSFETVDQVEAAIKDVAIVGKAPSPDLGVGLLHWIVADADRSIVIEYTKRGLEVFHDEADVLTNQPGFDWHRENLRNYMNVTNDVPPDVSWSGEKLTPFGSGLGMCGLPGAFSSPARFVRVAYFNAHYPIQEGEADNVSRLFHTLGLVAMIKGGARVASGEFEYTLYTGMFSAATKTYFYNDYDDPAIRSVSLADALAKGQGGKIVEIPLSA